jgi:hypothetical protein
LRRLYTVALAFLLSLAFTAPGASAQGKGQGKNPQAFNVLPITITSVVPQGGQLVANGIIGTTPFQIPLTLTAETNPSALATCPILNLALGPIHLNLLGLNVDTSPICLDITAQQGGGLLGDLLCGIANLLNGGLDLGSILGGLAPAQLETLNSGLTNVLNHAVFNPLTSSTAVTSASCDILNLALGPLDLNLLGLRVQLDDCNDGPVTVDITAVPGGGLLGDLLCNLSNLLNNSGGPTPAALALLSQIVAVIGGLLG